jgi:hypothetical protein
VLSKLILNFIPSAGYARSHSSHYGTGVSREF